MRIAALALLWASALLAQAPGKTAPKQPAPAAASKRATSLSFDSGAMDTTINPCVDFYQYACGSWIKKNPIPADQARWGRFSELEERNRQVLREVLDDASKPTAGRDPIARQIGDYYAACMDVAGIEARGLAPVQPELDRVRALQDKSELAGIVARFHRIGIAALFDFGSGQDFKNSSEVIAQADQGGLGMPDRDYYLKDDAKSVELRRQYLAHVERMLVLAGEPQAQAAADAAVVMKIETALAKASLDLVSRRDPEKVYHKMTSEELAALSPSFAWDRYFRAADAPAFRAVNVSSPEFFKAVDADIRGFDLAEWKTYLTWHVLHSEARLLPAKFVDENFDFYGKTLTGATEQRPRWKRCVDFTDGQLGEALGRAFVERTFGAEGKQRTLKMVEALEKALGRDLQQLPWMTPTTKKRALEKLGAITNKIGYPDKWRDYSSVVVRRDDAVGNGFRADEFEFARQLAKIGKPVDRGEWDMSPPTVNAYYDPLMNNINFPAGILQPPFYQNGMDDAVNFGGIGMVIGHELTHGFDDEGRQFDAKGNLSDWWTAEDAHEFEKRTACIVDEYSKFTPVAGASVNGKLTLGENTADNGGARVALMALMDTLAGRQPGKIEGFTAEQRFFLSFGQVWCENDHEEVVRLQVQTDPHSPSQYRVNGVVVNMPEFQKAFACKAGQPMVHASSCRVW